MFSKGTLSTYDMYLQSGFNFRQKQPLNRKVNCGSSKESEVKKKTRLNSKQEKVREVKLLRKSQVGGNTQNLYCLQVLGILQQFHVRK